VTPAAHLRAALSLAAITANLSFWIAVAFPTRLVGLVLPPARDRVHRALDAIYRAAVRLDELWLRRVVGVEWRWPDLPLDARRTWLVVSNHVSWSDIFLIQALFVRHGLVVKFLTKRELLALPVVGLILWTFEFPLLRRDRRRGLDEATRKQRDFDALREACRSAREAPVALVNFAEGTRATDRRRADRASPHRHLLPPRAGGFGALVDGLGEALAGVVDCTLVYPLDRSGRTPSFWSFLAGAVERVEVEAELVAPREVPAERDARARWLAARWSRKDERIERIRAAAPRRA